MLSLRLGVCAFGLGFEFVVSGVGLRAFSVLGDADGADELFEWLNKKGR